MIFIARKLRQRSGAAGRRRNGRTPTPTPTPRT
jgi:hypothetical protein